MTDSIARTRSNPENQPTSPLRAAAHALAINAAAVATLAGRIDGKFGEAVDVILGQPGRVVVSGMGKSGLVARKISATLASLGTPSLFVHSADASHGDLGMIAIGDTAVLISASGETEEVLGLIPYLRRLNIPILALTGDMRSTLARQADVALDGSIEREACLHNLAPTTSTLVAMALGDALAIALCEARGFQASDFAEYHPGGKLGKRLKTPVRDVMHRADLPICAPDTSLKAMLPTMSEGRLGLILVMDGQTLHGIVTDGDLRRGLERADDPGSLQAESIMTKDPLTIGPDATLYDADVQMHESKVTALVVADPAKKVLGVIQIHD
ncbi:KpsF/GutQ family sugar-phosphate isomerase [Parasphingopyxis marina]|uniref:KpsF/GutQ family sugar-phosphate isomerase n=1 Tax=Parasphingopyxis marina TaxID=2761622 RepID=A0A842I0T3_9SPHN|nr:KpsF/GutQ family sugar-phosphate isomerase [Parasphingopyxis marina]MBC2778293.1 KpsF/GutQ family sugar-phosphate isomerase [Parasphingopyxis marina]